MTALDDYIQMSGTVAQILSPETDSENSLVQRVMLTNLNATGSAHGADIITDPTALLMVRILNVEHQIPFNVGEPITIKGKYVRRAPQELGLIHSTHAPSGFIRYKGRIYR